ncbi:MAG: hypothetical protein ACOYJR_04925 [Acutalibacteraceae bacterium]
MAALNCTTYTLELHIDFFRNLCIMEGRKLRTKDGACMKQVRFLVWLLSSCSAVIFGVRVAFAASNSSKAELLLPVIEKLYDVLLKEWWICGGIFLVGAVYAVVFVLHRTKRATSKVRKEVNPK